MECEQQRKWYYDGKYYDGVPFIQVFAPNMNARFRGYCENYSSGNKTEQVQQRKKLSGGGTHIILNI